MSQQIYAKIKEDSEWYEQKQDCIDAGMGWPFPVHIYPTGARGYRVEGGIGGCYRLLDLDLFIVENGKELQIS